MASFVELPYLQKLNDLVRVAQFTTCDVYNKNFDKKVLSSTLTTTDHPDYKFEDGQRIYNVTRYIFKDQINGEFACLYLATYEKTQTHFAFVAFKGTDTPPQVQADARCVFQTTAEWREKLQSICNYFLPPLQEFLSLNPEGIDVSKYEWYTTGHSLGGAISAMAGDMLKMNPDFILGRPLVNSITFSSMKLPEHMVDKDGDYPKSNKVIEFCFAQRNAIHIGHPRIDIHHHNKGKIPHSIENFETWFQSHWIDIVDLSRECTVYKTENIPIVVDIRTKTIHLQMPEDYAKNDREGRFPKHFANETRAEVIELEYLANKTPGNNLDENPDGNKAREKVFEPSFFKELQTAILAFPDSGRLITAKKSWRDELKDTYRIRNFLLYWYDRAAYEQENREVAEWLRVLLNEKYGEENTLELINSEEEKEDWSTRRILNLFKAADDMIVSKLQRVAYQTETNAKANYRQALKEGNLLETGRDALATLEAWKHVKENCEKERFAALQPRKKYWEHIILEVNKKIDAWEHALTQFDAARSEILEVPSKEDLENFPFATLANLENSWR